MVKKSIQPQIRTAFDSIEHFYLSFPIENELNISFTSVTLLPFCN